MWVSDSLILLMFLADLLLGELPLPFPHPVVMIGRLVSRLENLFFPRRRQPAREKMAGLAVVVIVCLTVYGLTLTVLTVVNGLSAIAGWLLTLFLGYTCLACTGLVRAANDVVLALEREGLDPARKKLALIVGRQTDGLGREEIVKAVLETMAENLSDGVVAPLFYLFLGGVPLAMLYKAVNTMDSMLGYRNERYENFGRWAARLDDLANLVPARLTALLIIAAGWLQGYEIAEAWRILRRDRYRHASPNSGWPEAALAGLLGIRLGGPAVYFGRRVEKEYLGDERQPLSGILVVRTTAILYTAAWLMVGLGVVVR